MHGVPLPSNVLAGKRQHHQPCGSAACTDCGSGRAGGESPVTSTVPADPRPIQVGILGVEPMYCTSILYYFIYLLFEKFSYFFS